MMGFGWIFWIVIAAVILWILAAKLKRKRPVKDIREDKPLEILNERFARSEIDREEYERRWKKLQK
jgi:putative membrane protein